MQAAYFEDKGWIKNILEEFWTTFDIQKFSAPANPNDGIFTEKSKQNLDQILKTIPDAKLRKVKDGVLGMKGNKYFLWKDYGPIAWWDIAENDIKVMGYWILTIEL